MQQSDMSSSYYQYYQSHFQNPNPNPNPNDPQLNPLPTIFASAPPVSSNYSSSDHPAYDHFPNPPLTYPQNPSSQSYTFPHLMSQPSPYSSYDQNQNQNQNQMGLGYDQSNPGYNSKPISSDSYSHPGASMVPNYQNPYENGVNFDRYGAQGVQSDVGGARSDMGRYDYGGFRDDSMVGGVYAYNGGKAEPFGAVGSASDSSGHAVFDDYGRPISFPNGKEKNGLGHSNTIGKAIPITEMQQDMKYGVQKFRVKVLSESGGQSDMDVLCQIGLDGIRILDPATSRTLRIYPLETVEKWEVLDSYIFAFWAKSSVDFEPGRIRLKSNSYTTNNILDLVTAAAIQFKEMGGIDKPSDSFEQPSEKKKGFADWMNLMKPGNEEKDHWVPDETVTKCTACQSDFGAFNRKHHCRNCGEIFCDKCTQGRIALTAEENAQHVRVCDHCMAEVTQRLANTTEATGRVAALESHEVLARKLKEEMDKKRKISTGSRSDGSGTRMKEVACPTCTVHLQVQVPVSGSETIECSVCQHPFLVNAD